MNKNDLLNQRFTINPDEFIFHELPKIKINKSELIKSINFNLISQSYTKENRKFEDETVSDVNTWLDSQQDRLEKELTKFYKV